jgi:cold shock CspA family protein
MLTGRVKRIVHLSQQPFLPNTRLVPDHNDKGYGVIEAEDGQEVFFPQEAVEGHSGFEGVRNEQIVEYTLEAGPYSRAKQVRLPITTSLGVAPWQVRVAH